MSETTFPPVLATLYGRYHSAMQSDGNSDLLVELIAEVRGLRADIRNAEMRRDPLYQQILRELGKVPIHG